LKKVITTERFVEDNYWYYYNRGPVVYGEKWDDYVKQAKKYLKDKLNAKQVAIIPADDEILAHADGMVMFVEDNVIFVNDYRGIDSKLQDSVIKELSSSFPDVKIVEVPVTFSNAVTNDGISSACGININSVVTKSTIYVPTFNSPNDIIFVNLLKQYTTKNIVEIDATGVCDMGGSVRCLTLQMVGSNANKIIKAAELD
jgi:agmatine/peptidylarginine deiminase